MRERVNQKKVRQTREASDDDIGMKLIEMIH